MGQGNGLQDAGHGVDIETKDRARKYWEWEQIWAPGELGTDIAVNIWEI